MLTKRDLAIDALVSSNLADQSAGPHFDVYTPRLTTIPPTPGFTNDIYCVYFYYIRIDADGRVLVDHYQYAEGLIDDPTTWVPIPYGNVGNIIYQIAVSILNAITNPKIKKLTSNNFNPIPWIYRSYIAFFFDEVNWSFHRRIDGKPSVTVDQEVTPNHTFFDARDLTLNITITGSTIEQRTAIFFVNHMKGPDGNDLGNVAEKFKMDLWLQASYANSGTSAMTAIFDPGGTNQGPPIDP